MPVSTSHLVLLPAYNPGPGLIGVVTEVLRHWQPVLVVIDGSTDGSEQPLLDLASREPALRVLVLPKNSGKGAAVLAGAADAQRRGFTHALVMDADGQHPAASIAEFMAASLQHPATMILGRPVFPANIPPERLHGRKLSVGLVRLELLGAGVADPLFGFRVYPIAPLLSVLGGRRGGRRYDFDTEAAVRLVWAGVPPINLPAPVRYFSKAEGGISHFHYCRDNATLVRMHTRLITELLLWRWPAVRRHRRGWPATAAWLMLFLACLTATRAADEAPSADSAHRVVPTDAAWAGLAESFAHNGDVLADFTEQRFFPFKKRPVELKGEVRVSASHGLSLHYLAPEERTVILDDRGILIRGANGEKSPPPDPRAAAANEALLHLLRFDLAALGRDFVISGVRAGAAWNLSLVGRTETLRRSVGHIAAEGEAATIRRIEIRRSPRQSIEIVIEAPHPAATFDAETLARYFR